MEERRLGRRVWSGGLGRREDVAGGEEPAGSGGAWRSGGSGGACGAAASGGACGGAVGAGADVEVAAKSGSLTASLGSRRRRGLVYFREWRLIWGRGEGSGYIRQGSLVPVGGSNRD